MDSKATDNDYVSLKEYVITLVEHVEKRIDERDRAAHEAIKTAAESINRRLDAMNEFRAQIQEERAEYVTRKELDLRFKNAGWLTGTGALIAFVMATAAVIFHFLK